MIRPAFPPGGDNPHPEIQAVVDAAIERGEFDAVMLDYFNQTPEMPADHSPFPSGELEEWEKVWVKRQRERMGL